MKVKRTSISDFIRPLCEVKEKERGKKKDKERGTESVEDNNVCHDATITEEATSRNLTGDGKDTTASTVTTMTPPDEVAPSYHTSNSTVSDLPTASLCNKDAETSPSTLAEQTSGLVAAAQTPTSVIEQEWDGVGGGTQYEARRLKATKRSLRDGKSHSLILLTGVEPEDKENPHSKVSLGLTNPTVQA